MFYEIEIAGLKRSLELFKVGEDVSIAALIIFNDVELTVAAAKALLEKAGDFDIILTPEAKSIPLAYEMAKQSGKAYIVARKDTKLYMKNSISIRVTSITTGKEQTLYLSENDAKLLNGKRTLIVDDVISTGGSIKALEDLAKRAGGIIKSKATMLAEGEAKKREDLIFLETLPLFDCEGNPKE